MRLPGAARFSALLLLAGLLLSPAAAAPPSPSAQAPVDVQDALARLAAISSPPEYAASLDAFSTSLPPPDGLALLAKALDGCAPEYRTRLLVKAGDLALLLGLFGDAASHYEEAAGSGPVPDGSLLLRAARCYLAAGEPEKAQALSADLMLKAPLLSGAARLVGAWSLALQGRSADARALAASLLGNVEAAAGQAPALPAPAEQRREARFILWLFAPAEEKAKAASILGSEFPGSVEASIASGAGSPPPLPHWYLGGLGGFGTAPSALPTAAIAPPAPAAAAPVTLPAEAPTAPAKPQVQSAGGKRLQLGYFSVEDNAKALRDELAAKRFAASIEQRTKPAAAGRAEEKHWLVLVEGGKDTAKTIQALKDAGYESYIVE